MLRMNVLVVILTTLYVSYIDASFKRVNHTMGGAKVSHISVNVLHNQWLRATVHAFYQVKNPNECIKKCLFHDTCLSLNYFHQNIDTSNCFFLKENLYEHKELLRPYETALHIYVKNTGCEKAPCLNGGSCIPNFHDDTYKCKCLDTNHGHFCENKYGIPTPGVKFTFENNFNNRGTNSEFMFHSMANGRFTFVPDRVGQVLFCGHTRCVNSEHNPKAVPFNDIDILNKITISFWLKLRYWHRQELNYDTPSYACPIVKHGTGLEICFHRMSNQWYFKAFAEKSTYGQYHNMSYNKAQKWNHLALVWDKPNVKGFLNGKNEGMETELASDALNTIRDIKDWNIFNTDPKGVENNPMFIDNFNIWYDALYDEEIETIYNKNL